MIDETADIKTYITPYDTGIEGLMAQLLAGAKTSIRCAIYGCTLPVFFDGLVAAYKRGVDVKVIFDHTQAGGKAEAQALHALFLQIPPSNFLIGTSPKAHEIVHLKGTWVDESVVWSGSWNYSTSASAQVNNVDIVSSPARAKAFQGAFDQLWAWIAANEAAYQAKP